MNVSRLFRTALLSVLAFVLVGGIMAAQAQETFFVDGASGSDANDGTGPNDAFATIQQAFDAASNGDVVEIDGSAFYDETATLTKNLDVRVRQESPVRVNALVLDAGENTSSSTSSDERAQIADADDESNGDLQVVNSLEVISGFYEFTGGGADLELEDGVALTWNAGESSNGGSDSRFRSEQGQSGNAVRIALDGSYDLEIATSESYAINDDQLPDQNTGSGDIVNVSGFTVNNSGDIETPNDVAVGGTFTVNDGSRISPTGGPITVSGDVVNNGRIDTGSALDLAGSGTISGSGVFGDVDVDNSGSTYRLDSSISISGLFDVVAGELRLEGSFTFGTAGGDVELTGSDEVLNFDGDPSSIITDNGSNQVILSGSNAQQVDLNGSGRTIDFLTVDKGGVNPVTIANSGGSDQALTVDDNLNVADGRVQLPNGETFLGGAASTSLDLAGDATIGGSILLAATGGTSELTLTVSDEDVTIAGNGQIAVPVVANVSGNNASGNDATATFSELSSVSEFTKQGGSDVAFGQQVSVDGQVSVDAGEIIFSAGTASNSSGDLDSNGGTVTVDGDATFSGVSVASSGQVDFNGDVNLGAASFGSLEVPSGNVTVDGALTAGSDVSVDGTLDLNDPSPNSNATVQSSVTGSFDVLGNGTVNLKADHRLNLGNGVGTLTGDFDIANDAQTQLGLGSGGFDFTAGTVTFGSQASLRLFGGSAASPQTITIGGNVSIGDLIVENSRSEDDGNAVEVVSNSSPPASDQIFSVSDLQLLDGRLSSETNNGDGFSGEDDVEIQVTGGNVVRSAGSVVQLGDAGGDGNTDAFTGNYDLTYQNSSDISAGPEFSSNSQVSNLSVEGSGAVSLGASRTLQTSITVASGATLDNGGNNVTVNSGAGTPATVNGSFAGGGALIVSSGTVSGSGSISNLESNGGTVALGLSTDATVGNVTNGGGTIQTVDGALSSIDGALSLTGGSGLTLRENLTVGGALTHNSGDVILGTDGASLTLNGESNTINGSGAGYVFNGNGRVVFAGDAEQSLSIPSDVRINRAEINNSEGVTLTGNFALTTTNLVLTDGTFSHGTQLVAQAGGSSRITVVSGSLDGDFETGTRPTTVEYNHTGDITAGTELSGDVQNVAIDGDGTVTADTSFTVTNNLNLTSGTLATSDLLTFGSGSAQVNRSGGSLTGSPSVGGNTDLTVRYTPGSDITTGSEIPNGVVLENLILDAADQTVSLGGNASTSDADLGAGTLELGSDSLTVSSGTATIDGALQADGDGALVLDGASGATVDGDYTSLPTVVAATDKNRNGDFTDATISRSGSAQNVDVNGNLATESGDLVFGSNIADVNVSGDFTVESGARQFDNGGVDLSVAGDYTVEPAALNDDVAESSFNSRTTGAGDVILNGSDEQVVTASLPDGRENDFPSGLEVDNGAGVTAESPITTSTLALESGTVSMGENLLAVTDDAPGDVTGTGAVDGALRRDLGGDDAGSFEFPLSVDGSLQEATIVTDGSTFPNSDVATVTVTTQGSEFAGNQGLPFTTGSDGNEVEVNTKAPVGWTVSFDPEGSTPAAGEAPDFRFRAQGLEGIGDVNQLRVISRAGEGETGNPFSVAGTHEDALFSGGIPLVASSGVGGFDISNTQQFTFGSDSAVNDFADADQPAGQVAISGSVNYPTVSDGNVVDGRALEGVEVEATSGDVTATDTTDADGNFTISGLGSGDYEVTANVDRDVSNVSIGDAQRTVSGFAGTEPFAGAFQEEVADVNASGTANATDALRIAFFDLGSISSFEAGSFLVDTTEVTLGSESESGVTVRVAEFGDADLSGGSSDSGGDASLATTTVSPKSSAQTAAQTAAKSATESAGDANRVAAGETFEVPVRVDRGAEVGSYSLSLEYDTEKATFEGISSGRDDIITNGSKEDGTLQVGWFDRSGESTLELTGGSELVTLRFSAAEGVEGAEFAPEITSGEINGPGAKAVTAGVETQAVRIAKPAPDEFALNGSYPNPASQQATVEMDLPVRAQVTIEVYNTLGQRVQTAEQSMSAGAGQTVQLDASQLASGQYFYRVKASLDGNQTRETGRLTIVK